MSFALTTPQMRGRTKTVTRRNGWNNHHIQPGLHLQAVVKGQGLKKGEHVEKLGVIQVVSVRRERLQEIEAEDVAAEGFPRWGVVEFIDMYLDANGGTARQWVTRIEFRHVG